MSAEGIRPGRRKMQAVKTFATAIDVYSVRQFVGLVNYFAFIYKLYVTA